MTTKWAKHEVRSGGGYWALVGEKVGVVRVAAKIGFRATEGVRGAPDRRNEGRVATYTQG